MSGVSLDYQISDADVRKVLSRMMKLDRAAVLDEIGMEWHSLTMDRFLTSTAPDGTQWQPSLRALMEGGKTLVDHAHLRDSFTHHVLAGGDGLEFGSNMVYAAVHQDGYKGTVNVKPHNRLVTQAFGKSLKFPVHATVGAYSFTQNIEARPILPEDNMLPAEYSEVIGDALHDRLMELMRA